MKYRGGKYREISHIEPYLPSNYERYIEPFFGGGALYFYLEPERAIINDLNSKLMMFYSDLRENPDIVRSELLDLQMLYEKNRTAFEARKAQSSEARVIDDNEALYYSIRDMFNGITEPCYSLATIYYFINKTAYSGMIRYNKGGEFNVPYGRYKNFNTQLITQKHVDLLARATLMCGDYQNVFNICSSNDFMFLDPPYDCIFSDYGNKETADGFTEIEHRRLAKAYYELPCKALMVIGKTQLTESLYKESIVAEYKKSYAVNIRNRFKSEGKHILVANF